MTEYTLSNANDVVIKVGNAETGSARLVMDSWNFGEDIDGELAHGASNEEAVALSEGNVSREFEFTARGEDANLWNELVGESGAKKVQIVVKTKLKIFNFHTAFILGWDFDGSDGEDNELSLSGVMFEPDIRNR